MQCQFETIELFFFLNARLASFQIQASIHIEKLKVYIVIADIVQLITEKLKDFFYVIFDFLLYNLDVRKLCMTRLGLPNL